MRKGCLKEFSTSCACKKKKGGAGIHKEGGANLKADYYR